MINKIKLKKKKAIVGMFIVFVIFAVILFFLFGFGIPMLINFNSGMYEAGQDIINTINISNMTNSTSDAILSAKNSMPQQINILSVFLKYSWVIILFVLVLIIYIRSRSLIEVQIR